MGAVTLRGDAVVLGIALNLLAVGLTSFLLLRTVFGVQGTFDDPSLAGLPLAGGFSLLAYLAWAAVGVAALMLSRHVWGLRLRGVGEAPDAAATLGVSPVRYQYGAVLVSGVLCGLAGAQLALGNVTLFSENMTAGRGWIAVVAVDARPCAAARRTAGGAAVRPRGGSRFPSPGPRSAAAGDRRRAVRRHARRPLPDDGPPPSPYSFHVPFHVHFPTGAVS